MLLWRISNHAALDGRGGLVASARWHTEGHPIVYFAESPAGALTEMIVHLELDARELPKRFKLLKVEAPEDIPLREISSGELPRNWQEDEDATRAIGDAWLAAGATALLRVPSVIVPETYNILLNPKHPDAARVKVISTREYPWDKRLFE